MGANSQVRALEIQPDNKILVGGLFTTYHGSISNFIVRLLPDGRIDDTFDIGTGFNGEVRDITQVSENRIIVVGNFDRYRIEPDPSIIRLDEFGTHDTTFDTQNGFNGVIETINENEDGIFVGGEFTEYKGKLITGVIQITDQGSESTRL